MEERRFTVPARAYRQALTVVAVLLVGSPALAVPKDGKAKAAFEEGIAAYQKSDYAGAAEAFGKSYVLEADLETLFAWAQAERQAEHCEKAVELYEKLLGTKLPDENKQVVSEKLGECRKIIAARQPKPAPVPDKPAPTRVDPTPEGTSRFKDPVGGLLVGAGVVGLGVGAFFLVSSKSAAADSKTAANYFDVIDLRDKADSRGKLGVIATAAGAALLLGGVVRYATRGGKTEHRAVVSGWIAPSGGGVVALGRF